MSEQSEGGYLLPPTFRVKKSGWHNAILRRLGWGGWKTVSTIDMLAQRMNDMKVSRVLRISADAANSEVADGIIMTAKDHNEYLKNALIEITKEG